MSRHPFRQNKKRYHKISGIALGVYKNVTNCYQQQASSSQSPTRKKREGEKAPRHNFKPSYAFTPVCRSVNG